MKINEFFKKVHVGQAVAVAVSVGVFFPLIVPLQTYIANRAMFDFGLYAVLLEAIPVVIILTALVFLILMFSESLLGRLLHVILLAVFVCAYLECGIFSMGLPSLDGDLAAFANPFRKIIDTGLLVLFFGTLVGLYKWVKTIIHWIAWGVLTLSAASLLDVRPPESAQGRCELAPGFCPQYDVVKSARFSANRNVIMLILDTFRASMASDVINANPELKTHFKGFVAYEKNLAMHETTCRALPGLMTGRYLTPDLSANDYSMSIFGDESFIVPYVKTNAAVYFSDQLLTYGYTSRRLGDFTKIADSLNKTGSVFFQNSNSVPYISLWDVAWFRAFPYWQKRSILVDAYGRALAHVKGHHLETFHEDKLYPVLASAPVDNDEEMSLLVFHTSGPHGPITRDRYGKYLPIPTQDIAAYYEYSYFVLKQVATFFDTLKKRNLYDNSFIVIAADHGLIDQNALKRMAQTGQLEHHGADSSILWVKPFDSNGNFAVSTIPTSNCRVSNLMRTIAHKDVSQREVDTLLHAKDRRFIAKFGTAWYSMGRYVNFSEWRYNDDGDVISCENKGIWTAN